MEYLINIACMSLFSAFMLCFGYKAGVVNRLCGNRYRIIREFASCEFCLSFWMNTLIALIIMAYSQDLGYLWTPVITTPITRKLIA